MRLSTKQTSQPHILGLFVAFMLAAQSAFHSPALAQPGSVQELWLDVSIGPPIIPLFNQAARAGDIARVEHPSQAGQLSAITTGRKMVIFKSITETEQFLRESDVDIDIIGYNLEHNQITPAGEKADPVSSIKQMRALADEYGLELAFGPDHDFALSHGVQMAPYVDIFVLQIQRQQTNPAVVEEFVAPLVPQLREANPDLEISVQVRTEGDVAQIVDLLDSLKVHLDGVSILTSPQTVEVAGELLDALRPAGERPLRGPQQASPYILPALLLIGLAAGVLILRSRRAAAEE